MKKIFFIFMILTLCLNPAFADTAPLMGAGSGLSNLFEKATDTMGNYIDAAEDFFGKLKSMITGYSIDRRKYVTNFEKTMIPFSSIVALQDKGDHTYCTATLTTDGIVVTAKHCLENPQMIVLDDRALGTHKPFYTPMPQLRLASNGQTLKYDKTAHGNYDDFAFIAVLGNHTDGIRLATIPGASVDAMVVGYGGLRILSDNEIKTIRHQYAKWIKGRNLKPSQSNEIADEDGVDLKVLGSTGSAFVKDIQAGRIPGVDKNIFSDSGRLKKSYCRVTKNGEEMDCQTWSGNSGGSVFAKMDDTWFLFGEHIQGGGVISGSGSTHAHGTYFVPVSVFGESYRSFLGLVKNKRAQTAD